MENVRDPGIDTTTTHPYYTLHTYLIILLNNKYALTFIFIIPIHTPIATTTDPDALAKFLVRNISGLRI